MNGTTAGNRGPRLVIAMVAVAVVALLATTFRVHTQTSFATGAGPAGSAAHRQEIAFVQCMRGHGVPDLPDPPPGDSVSVPVTQTLDACKQLAPRGRETTNVQIRL
jgi:hypothetical protein